MKRKHLLNTLRVLISVGLIAFVCSSISVDDTLVRQTGEEVVGRLQKKDVASDSFVIQTPDGGTVEIGKSELQHQDGQLVGVKRGIITVFRDIDLGWFIPICLMGGLIPFIGSVRLHMLFGVQGVKIPFRLVFGFTFIGLFFSNFMLGLTGGDVVKAYYVLRETDKRGEALITVFLDRLIGLVSMALLAGAMILFNLNDPRLAGAAVYVWIFLFVAFLAGLMVYSRKLRKRGDLLLVTGFAVMGGVLMAWRVRTYGFEAIRLEVLLFLVVLLPLMAVSLVPALRKAAGLDKLKNRLSESRLVREMDGALHVFSKRGLTGVVAVLMSVLCHTVTVCLIFGFARSIGVTVPFRYFLVFIPVILIIAAMPISLAGWGVQEAVFQIFFGSVGVSPTESLTMSFIFRIAYLVLWSLPGGVMLMLKKDRPSADEVERGIGREEAVL